MIWKTLAVLIILLAGGIVYSFLQLRAYLHEVYVVPDAYAITSAEPDLYIVEFTSLSCEFSHTLYPILNEAIKKDGKIKFIPRPIVDPEDAKGKIALEFLYAAAEQGAFEEVYNKLNLSGPDFEKDELMEIAKSFDLDLSKIEEDMASEKIKKIILDNKKFFDDWQFNATPTLLIGTGWMGTKAIYVPRAKSTSVEELLQNFQMARKWF